MRDSSFPSQIDDHPIESNHYNTIGNLAVDPRMGISFQIRDWKKIMIIHLKLRQQHELYIL